MAKKSLKRASATVRRAGARHVYIRVQWPIKSKIMLFSFEVWTSHEYVFKRNAKLRAEEFAATNGLKLDWE